MGKEPSIDGMTVHSDLLSRHICGRRFTTRSTLVVGIMSPATISGLHVAPLALLGSEL